MFSLKLSMWNGEEKGHNGGLELKWNTWTSKIFVTRIDTEHGNMIWQLWCRKMKSFIAVMYLYSPNICVTCLGKFLFLWLSSPQPAFKSYF